MWCVHRGSDSASGVERLACLFPKRKTTRPAMITPMMAPDTPPIIAMLVFDNEVDEGDDEDGGTEDGPVFSETLGAGVSMPAL